MELHVSIDGDDSAAGSIEEPVRSLKHAVIRCRERETAV